LDIVSITADARVVICQLCNKATSFEYDMILGYPRLIDHIINFEKVTDKQLINDIDKLGKESLGHFQKTDNLITRLGGHPDWQASIFARLVDIETELEKQLEKEIYARDNYREAKKVALNNKHLVKGREFFGRTFRVRSGVSEDLVSVDEITAVFDRLIMDEERHARVVTDSLATFKALKKRA